VPISVVLLPGENVACVAWFMGQKILCPLHRNQFVETAMDLEYYEYALRNLPEEPDELVLFSNKDGVSTYGLLLPRLKPNGYLSSLGKDEVTSYAMIDKEWQQYKSDSDQSESDGMSTGSYREE
jgi:hypothetical protein